MHRFTIKPVGLSTEKKCAKKELLSRSDSGQANAPAESSILDMGIGSFWPSQKAGVQ